MLQLVQCFLGRHRRSERRRARGEDGRMRSECCGCGVPMVHDKETGWQVDHEASQFAAAA